MTALANFLATGTSLARNLAWLWEFAAYLTAACVVVALVVRIAHRRDAADATENR